MAEKGLRKRVARLISGQNSNQVLDMSNTVRHGCSMFNILSILVGLVAFVIALVGLVPLLGWLNWLALPMAIVGTALGLLSDSKSGRNLNLLVLIFGGFRLFLGGGFI